MNPATRARVLPLLGALALQAQTPFHADGPALGGSRIFSTGLNPLGSPARVDLSPSGLHLAYLDGGQEAKDFQKQFNQLASGLDLASALKGLADSPWALRTRGYALTQRTERDLVSLSREETTSLFATFPPTPAPGSPVVDPVGFQQRRTVVDRLVLATATRSQTYTFGAQFRIERWSHGLRSLALKDATTQDPWSFRDTPQRTLVTNLDLAAELELMPGLKAGATVDRLLRKRLWDVEEKPQVRAGLQMDLGTLATLSAETDLNAAARMPYVLPQRNASASLTLKANHSITLVVGAERRKIGDVSTTRGGITVWIHPGATQGTRAPFLIGAGLQIGADKPLRGLSAWGSL